jgi:segregation and condensation protein A
LTGNNKKIDLIVLVNRYYTKSMSDDEEISSISQDPVNILFNPSVIQKKDVWQINLIEILKLLIKILEETGKKDLKVAGMAALSSSLIYRMKVESIFALQKAAMEKKPLINRRDVDIDILDIPYRHESTYPVSLDELLDLLENLIGSIANPRSRRNRQLDFDAIQPPDFKEYFIPFENLVVKYESLIIRKIRGTGSGLLKQIVADLDSLDSIRCFFAVLFLARDQKVELEQTDDDIQVTLIDDITKKEKEDNENSK